MAGGSLEPGLYAELVTNRLAALLESSTSEGQLVTALLRDADAPDRLARYIAGIVAEAVLAVDEDKRTSVGLNIVTSLLHRLEEQSPADREVLMDAIFKDSREQLLARVQQARDEKSRDLAQRALRAHDYVYDVFESAEGIAA